jgi:hypothetical protein
MAEAITIYETRTMLEAISKQPSNPTFLKDTFFKGVDYVPTENIDFDFKRGKRIVAPYVDENDPQGEVMERQEFQPISFSAPLIAPVRALGVYEIKGRRYMGENIYSQQTAAERAVKFLAQDVLELDLAITRAEEVQIAQLMTKGYIHIVRYNDAGAASSTQTLTYGTPTSATPGTTSGYGALWSTSGGTGCTPLVDLQLLAKTILQNSTTLPNVIISDSTALEQFISIVGGDQAFWPARLDVGTIRPDLINDNVYYAGRLRIPAVDWYTYDNWFLDPANSNTETTMIPTGNIIMGNTRTMSKIVYGSVTQMEGDGGSQGTFQTYMAARVPKVWTDYTKDKRMLKISSRPLPVPDDFLSWGILKTNG